MTYRAILFDADGVVQRPAGVWRAEMAGLIEPGADLDAFIADVVAAERPCLVGAADFPTELRGVLTRWSSTVDVDTALSVWRDIIVDHEILDAVGALRRDGIICCVASNQHAQRAAYMRTQLRYDAAFDRQFYSCEVGHAKPDRAFFEAIIANLALPPQHVLFFDDHDGNAAAAREVGIHGVHFEANAGTVQLVELLDELGLNTTDWTQRR
jgi:putative hydrolase of the HAD superfamily